MTIMRLTKRQQKWLQQASQAQRNGFMVEGPMEVGMFANLKEDPFQSCFRPAIRGILVGGYHPSPDDAQREGEKIFEELKALPPEEIEVVDEDALGISSSNQGLVGRLDDATLAFDKILHLGAVCAAGDKRDDAFEEFCTDLDDHTLKTLVKDLPFLKKLLHEAEATGDFDSIPEELRQTLFQAGTFGFLVQSAHPVMTYQKGFSGASYSWGSYNTAWFYGESLDEVATKAVKWADALDRENRRKAKASA